MKVPAINTGQSVEYNPCMADRPRGIVILGMEFMKIKGLTKSFHVHIKIKTPRVAKAGLHSGINILQKTPKGVQPSIFPASTNSSGRVRKNCLIRKVP